MQYLGSPVNKMMPLVIYIILIFTGVLNLVIIDYSYYMGDLLGEFSMIDLEMAGTIANANHLLNYWNGRGVLDWIYFHLGLDYLFIVSYSVFLFFACHTSALQIKSFPFFIHLGLVIGWVQPLAGILDVVENYALLHILSNTTNEFWAQIANLCAVPKFAIALSGFAYCVLALTISTSSGIVSKIRPIR